MRLHLQLLVLVGLLAGRVTTQEAASRPSSRLADQLVRHFLERDSVVPPTLRSGQALALGEGPLVLLARRGDGALELQSLVRRAEGPVKPPSAITSVEIEEKAEVPREVQEREAEGAAVEEEVVEVVELPTEAPAAAPRRLQRPRRNPGVRLKTTDSGTVVLLDGERFGEGAELDLPALTRALKERAPADHPHVVLSPQADVALGAVLAVASAAHAAGLGVQFGGGSVNPPLRAVDRETIRTLPDTMDWKTNERGLYDGEVLLLFGHDQPWSAIEPVIREFVKFGVWRLAFVGVDGQRTRYKVPTPIPVDPGVRFVRRRR